MKYYIIGFAGSGKSTFGSELAATLGYSFLDLDKEIEKKSGHTISELFEKKGEDAFRKLEHEALMDTFRLENCVIATGGGTPCFDGHIDLINEHGTSIYLKLFENELYKRLEPEQESRPLIRDKSPEQLQEYIYQTLRQRSFYYHQAKIVLDGMNVKAKELAEILQEKAIPA